MTAPRTFSGSARLLKTLLAGVVLPWGCADLRLEADRIPTELALVAGTDLLTVGESTKLVLVVRDQNGEAMTMPSWAPPTWKVSDTQVAAIGPDGTLTGLQSGMADVTVRVGSLETAANFRVNPDQVHLTAPVIYLTQAAQNRRGSVRLIAGRPALLRIFAVVDLVNWFEPAVNVALLQGNDVVFERLLRPQQDQIPTTVDESNLIGSYNVEVPGSAIHPGVRMVVELDPEGVVPLAPGSRVRYPESGSSELLVAEPQLFRQIFVPTIIAGLDDRKIFEWLDGIGPDSDQMRYTRNLLPVSRIEVEVRETFHMKWFGWHYWLNSLRAMHIQEGRRGYYYGLSSWVGGGGANVGVPWSGGVPKAWVYGHEVGHNMNLLHASCGDPPGVDPEYPHPDGSIGIWGYDVALKQLYDPVNHMDFMSYCDPRWISDYHFEVATTHRLDGDGGVIVEGESNASRAEMLVVWGSVLDGELTLDPAFVLEGPAELPRTDGPYRVEGLGAGGETMFSLSFAPTPLADGGGTFVYFVPYEQQWATSLDRMVLTGPEGEYTMTRGGQSEMAVLTDPSTGMIRAILHDWNGEPIPGEATARVTISRGIPAGGLR